MNNEINKLLRLNLEIEGVLRILINRESEEAKAILAEKFADFSIILNKIINSHHEETPASDSIPLVSASLIIDDTNISTTPDDKDATAPIEVHIDESEATKEIADAIEEKAQAQNNVADIHEEIDTDTEIQSTESSDQASKHEDENKTVNSPEVRFVPLDEEETSMQSEKTEPQPARPTRIEDMIAMKEAKTLIGAFTINDKFRFIRGIFCEDKADFEDTVARLSECDSLGEAYDYLLNELGWDPDNEEVKDFISIAANYFNAL